MLALNNVSVLEPNQKPQPPPKTQDISNWPLLDSRGNSLDDLGRARASKKPPEKNQLRWRDQRTPETDDENTHPAPVPVDELEFSDEDDLDGEEEEMEATIKNKIGNSERNYMYPEHVPGKHDPAKPPMLKFKASLFSRNVLVVNRALKKFMNKEKSQEEEERREDEMDKRMARRGEGRVQSSKRRQQMTLRNQYAELTVNYDELLKENKLLKQIQKRQERELDRFTNADEDLPRLLDANNYEIAGLKAKNKQLLFEKRELDDKLRRQHQEIMTLKEQNKKMTTLANNKKLGEREKLELELTTARVTIAHQENKIQDLTKAVEIYKKAADREVKGNQLQLKRAQNSLRDLQDAYNELFLKYKAKEKELGNQNIYAQRGRAASKRSHFRTGQSTQSNPNLISVASYNSTTNNTPAPPPAEKKPEKLVKSTPHLSSLQRLETELELLNSQSDSLADLEKVLEEESKSPEPSVDSPPPSPKPSVTAAKPSRPKSASTLASDTEDEFDTDEDEKPKLAKETPKPITPKVESVAPPEDTTTELQKRIQEEARLAQEAADRRKAEEARKSQEEARKAEEAKRKAEEEQRRAEEERKRAEERRAAAEQKAKEEEAARLAEEKRLVDDRKKKDEALKEKLAAVRRNAGGDDFMSQLKAKKTPSVSPSQSNTSERNSPPAAPVERTTRKSGSGDDLRKAAALNNANSRRRKSSNDDLTSGYQPSFATAKPAAKPKAGKADPFGVEISTEYTPSFSNTHRVSRDSNNKSVWSPAGRASTSERNGLFESSLDHSPLLKRRASKSKNTIPIKTYDQDDDLEELML